MSSLPDSYRIRRPPDEFEWIDRTRPLEIRFEGEPIAAYTGDCVTSALLANGHRVFGYSARLRRARGAFGGVLIDAGERGLLLADEAKVERDMQLRRLRSAADGAPLPSFASGGSRLAVGKLHHAESLAEPLFEQRVRRLVKGSLPTRPIQRVVYPTRLSRVDVVVVGAGLAGLAAALAAAERGLKVTVLEADPSPGGKAFSDPAKEALHGLLGKLQAMSQVELRCCTAAIGLYPDRFIVARESTGLLKLRAGCVVLATGRIELRAVFPNNDLPGVMTPDTANRLIARYAIQPCRRALVLVSESEHTALVERLHAAGVEVAGVLDAGADTSPSLSAQIEQGVAAADGSLCAVMARQGGRARERFDCDGLIASAGNIAADSLSLQARNDHAPHFGQIAREVAEGVWATGSLRGVQSVNDVIDDGNAVGTLVAERLGRPGQSRRFEPARVAQPEAALAGLALALSLPAATPFAQSGGESSQTAKGSSGFVDLDEDVELSDLRIAVDEGFRDSGLLNAYTKFGRGFSQDKTSHAHAAALLSHALGRPLSSVGRPVPRPPVHPLELRLLAGRSFRPRRQSPLHDWHREHGAEFSTGDDWRRPMLYRAGNDRNAAIGAEVRAVREAIGLIDVSTLGKIDVVGPDAVALLERLYIGAFADLSVGAIRYVILCDEAGSIVDDGVAARLAPDHFYLTTTTSGSGAVYRELQRWAQWLRLDVRLYNLTGGLAAMNLTGPRAPELVAELSDDPSVLLELPYLGVQQVTCLGAPLRALRVGFVGEWGYELHVPASSALSLWLRLAELGEKFGLRPFGVEAQRRLRLEKGHLIVGHDTDSLTTPYEVGLGRLVKLDKPEFISRRSLAIRKSRPQKRSLVSFELPASFTGPEPQECDLVLEAGSIAGRVTSVVRSDTLGRVIGLAYVPASKALAGREFTIRINRSHRASATVVKGPFYDPTGERQRSAGA